MNSSENVPFCFKISPDKPLLSAPVEIVTEPVAVGASQQLKSLDVSRKRYVDFALKNDMLTCNTQSLKVFFLRKLNIFVL